MNTFLRILLSIACLILFLVILINWLRTSRESKMPQPEPEAEDEPSPKAPVQQPSLSGAQVVDALAKLGYFSFTAPENLAAVKHEIQRSYDSWKILSSEVDEETLIGQCLRYHFCDSETLFEVGGLEEYLLQVKPVFEKLGIPLEWSEEYWSEDIALHTIVLNGKQYDAFRGDPNSNLIWTIAMKNFAEMLNDQLALHGSDEKIYPMGGGNDGHFYILTDAQYGYIREHFTSDEVPRTVKEWWSRGG